jgi:hypothetical protein
MEGDTPHRVGRSSSNSLTVDAFAGDAELGMAFQFANVDQAGWDVNAWTDAGEDHNTTTRYPEVTKQYTHAYWLRTASPGPSDFSQAIAGVQTNSGGWRFELRANLASPTWRVLHHAVGVGTVNWQSNTWSGVANQLYHVAVTWEEAGSNQVELYIDGVLFDSGTMTGAQAYEQSDDQGKGVLIGNSFATGNWGTGLDGAIGDVRLYDRKLTAAEIWNLYAPQTRWDIYRVDSPRGAGFSPPVITGTMPAEFCMMKWGATPWPYLFDADGSGLSAAQRASMLQLYCGIALASPVTFLRHPGYRGRMREWRGGMT